MITAGVAGTLAGFHARVRVTRWTFRDGDETGHHVHEYDYLVVPLTGGTFTAKSRDFVSRVSNPVVDKPIDITALRALVASRVLRKQA